MLSLQLGIYFLRAFGNILARLQIQILPVPGTILYVNVQNKLHTFQDKRNFNSVTFEKYINYPKTS